MAGEPKPDPAREQNRRRIYVAHRLPIVTQELGQLRLERKKLQTDMKAAAEGKKKAELRKRQIYVAVRMDILRQEKKSIAEERKSLIATLSKQV